MQLQEYTRAFDVVIVGAGPAGSTCALALKDAGLKVALIDKQAFPRDKVCGDAIPLRAIKTLDSISPLYGAAFKALPACYATKSTALIYKGNRLTFNWVGEAYTCTRKEFDNFLFSLVQSNTDTAIYTHTSPEKFVQENDGITIHLTDGRIFTAKMIIGADGAQSVTAKQLTNKILDREHHVSSVRAYYTNLAVNDNRTMELYFDKQIHPGYLWVFPLPGNIFNVGFGMLSGEIARKKLNIKKAFYEFIEQTPELKNKFKYAVQTSPLEGFGLPLGSKTITISGDHFMLTGDAASLIDPITGEGIGNAMLSGKLAAGQVLNCFRHNNFSAGFMKAYDNNLDAAIGKELKTRYRAQQLLSKMPVLIDLVFLAGKNKMVKRWLQKSF